MRLAEESRGIGNAARSRRVERANHDPGLRSTSMHRKFHISICRRVVPSNPRHNRPTVNKELVAKIAVSST